MKPPIKEKDVCTTVMPRVSMYLKIYGYIEKNDIKENILQLFYI